VTINDIEREDIGEIIDRAGAIVRLLMSICLPDNQAGEVRWEDRHAALLTVSGLLGKARQRIAPVGSNA
jgi:hypothetical protein